MKTISSLFLATLLFLPLITAISISPETISMNEYAGECKQIPFTINNSHETDLPAYIYYTTNLEDITGLTLKTENPFIAKKGDTQIPIQICTANNFAPSTFTITLYIDANIEHTTQTNTQTIYMEGGTSYAYVYKDKNVYVDKNIIVQVPKEIIKQKIVEKKVEVPIEKIVEKIVQTDTNKENKASGLFGLVELNIMEIIWVLGVLLVICILGIVGYVIFNKPTVSQGV
jgi:hypothetical protein